MHISSKCSVAVHCLIFLHEYGARHKVTSDLLAQSSGCNPVTIRSLMSAMKKDGMIAWKSGTGGAVLNGSPETITLYQVWTCVDPDGLEKMIGIHPNPSSSCPVGRNIQAVLERSYEKLRASLEQSLQSISLQDILMDYHQSVQHQKEKTPYRPDERRQTAKD